MKSKAPAPGPTYQAIAPDELLPLPVVKARLRWGDQTISQARKDGLRVLRYGKWGYCLGRDLIAFIEQQAGPVEGEPHKCCGRCHTIGIGQEGASDEV
jgi:hypothetical protein